MPFMADRLPFTRIENVAIKSFSIILAGFYNSCVIIYNSKSVKAKKKVLITGSAGLVGSESSRFFSQLGFTIFGIDDNMREYFLGKVSKFQSEYPGWKYSYTIDRILEDLCLHSQS